MRRPQTQTYRLQVVIDLKTHAFLEKLAAKGMHGNMSTAIARLFIEQGVREAIKDRFLSEAEVKAITDP